MKSKHRLIAFIIVLVAFIIVAEVTGLRDWFTLSHIKALFLKHWAISSSVFLLVFCLGNLLYIPGLIFLAGAVLSLGKVLGGLLTFLTALTCCSFFYFLVDFIAPATLRKIEKPWLQKLLDQLDTKPIRNIAILRIIFQTAPFLNYTLPMSGVKFRHYFLGTLIGLPLPILVYCLLFEQIFQKLM